MASSELLRPPGAVATALGGLAGAFVGTATGVPIANANASSGLEGLGQALLIMMISLCLGTTLGVGLALRLSAHRRPLISAILAMPAVFVAIVVALRVSSSFDGGRVFDIMIHVLMVIVALWLTRIVSTAGSRPDTGRITAG